MTWKRKLGLVATAITIPVAAWAFRSPLIWTETVNMTVDDCATGNHRLQTLSAVGYFFTEDNTVFVDDTTDINDAGTGDVDPWPGTPVATQDFVYWGSDVIFNSMRVTISTQGSTVMTVGWQYYDGDSWETLTTTREDWTDYDEAVGTHQLNFNPPGDWAATTINSQSAFWARQNISAFTSHTTNALLTQGWIGLVADNDARQLVIRSDPDETEVLWCDVSSSAAVDVGFPLDAGTGSLTVEVRDYAHEVYCCGDGGGINIQVLHMFDGA